MFTSTAPAASVRPVMTPALADLYAHALDVMSAAVDAQDAPTGSAQETADAGHELAVAALVVDLIATEYDLP